MSFSPLQNKLKKIKEKYKDQDEEDRELMMQLLAVRIRTRHPTPSLWLCGGITDEPLFFFSLLVPPRRRRRRGRKERRGRGKKSPLESLPLRNQPRKLITWRRRNQRRWEERKREERKEELLNRRRRYHTSGGADCRFVQPSHPLVFQEDEADQDNPGTEVRVLPTTHDRL